MDSTSEKIMSGSDFEDRPQWSLGSRSLWPNAEVGRLPNCKFEVRQVGIKKKPATDLYDSTIL